MGIVTSVETSELLQLRQQGEADVKAELWYPFIRPVASLPARRLAGLQSAWGHGGDGDMALTLSHNSQKENKPSSYLWGDGSGQRELEILKFVGIVYSQGSAVFSNKKQVTIHVSH